MVGIFVESNFSLEILSGVLGYQVIFFNDNFFLNVDGFEFEFFLCYYYGIVCLVCFVIVVEKFIWCKMDDDNLLNGEFIWVLKDFKVRSFVLKVVLEDEVMVNDIQKELFDYVCSCSDLKYVYLVSGYYVECIEKFCFKKEIFM